MLAFIDNWRQVWPNLEASVIWVIPVTLHNWWIHLHLKKIHRALEGDTAVSNADENTAPDFHRIEETHNRPDRRLGRHVNHDSRSVRYAEPVMPKSAIFSVDWTRRIPILDQGQLGSCTGNAGTGLLGTDSATWQAGTTIAISEAGAAASHGVFEARSYTLDEDFAVGLYSLATILDAYAGQYPPTDTGSSGLGVAKALVALGLADKYTHAFSLSAMLSALQRGPVLLGTVWLNSMFNTDSNGHLIVDHGSGVAGGHELEVCRYEVATATEPGKIWMPNSWATSFGENGWCYVTEAEMKWLLSQQGDVTVPNLITAPTPPQPPTPAGPSGAEVAAAVRSTLTQLGV
jgi:hypothetical protein